MIVNRTPVASISYDYHTWLLCQALLHSVGESSDYNSIRIYARQCGPNCCHDCTPSPASCLIATKKYTRCSFAPQAMQSIVRAGDAIIMSTVSNVYNLKRKEKKQIETSVLLHHHGEFTSSGEILSMLLSVEFSCCDQTSTGDSWTRSEEISISWNNGFCWHCSCITRDDLIDTKD